MWTVVDFDDRVTLQRCVDVLRVVFHRYEKLDVDRVVRPWMRVSGGQVLYYRSGEAQIVMAIEYHPRRASYYLRSFGFVGLSAEQAVELVLDRLKEFLREADSERCYGAVGHCESYPPVAEFLRLLPGRSDIETRMERCSQNHSVWHMKLITTDACSAAG